MDKDADIVLGGGGTAVWWWWWWRGVGVERIWKNKKETFKILSLLERFKNT